MSLEACAACLHVLAAPGMPKQVYKEELIDRLVGFIRFQLMHNVLVFHDAALCQASRPELLSPGRTCLPVLPQKTVLLIAVSLMRCNHVDWSTFCVQCSEGFAVT